jgi:O-acetyl-ADP-ribose deacetylase (regulator of RNase III)
MAAPGGAPGPPGPADPRVTIGWTDCKSGYNNKVMADQPELTREFGKITVRLVHDSIAARKVDAIILGANTQLLMGGGVASAVLARGGIEIQKEALARAPAPLGSVVRTRAGRLAARYVYHAVVIDEDVSKGTSINDVAAAVRSILKSARADNSHSLAMPLFGAGVGGLTVGQSLEAVLETVEELGGTYDRDLMIEIVVFGTDEFAEVTEAFQGYKDRTSRSKEEDELAAEFLKEFLHKK